MIFFIVLFLKTIENYNTTVYQNSKVNSTEKETDIENEPCGDFKTWSIT